MPLVRFRLNRRLEYSSCTCVLFIIGVLPVLSGQIPPEEIIRLPGYASLPLRVTSDEAFGRTWRVVSAELRENITAATWGVLELQNASKTALEEARFYAEYYDARGRRCLTLAFAGEANSQQNGKPIEAGETRELLSLAAGLSPAAKPVEVRLKLVSQRPVGHSTEIVSGERFVLSPVTLMSLSGAPLTLNLNSLQRQSQVVDLILAKITVDVRGTPESVEVLNVSSDGIREWFDAVVRQRFEPASIGFVETPGTCLLLVRVVMDPSADPSATSAREAPWIKAYASTFRGNELPTVNEVIFVPSSPVIPIASGAPQPRPSPSQNPDLFDLVFSGSEWSANIFKLVSQKRSGGWARRWMSPHELVK